MKKTIQKVVDRCDICGKEDVYVYKCLHCGKEMCYKCSEKSGIEYAQELGLSGGEDGFYCKECDAKLSKDKTDKLHNAYIDIQNLAKEYDDWYKNFNYRTKLVESEIARLRKKVL